MVGEEKSTPLLDGDLDGKGPLCPALQIGQHTTPKGIIHNPHPDPTASTGARAGPGAAPLHREVVTVVFPQATTSHKVKAAAT